MREVKSEKKYVHPPLSTDTEGRTKIMTGKEDGIYQSNARSLHALFPPWLCVVILDPFLGFSLVNTP
jgi:hypothetical protein